MERGCGNVRGGVGGLVGGEEEGLLMIRTCGGLGGSELGILVDMLRGMEESV